MKLRNELCPIHRSLSCCGRELPRALLKARGFFVVGVELVETTKRPRVPSVSPLAPDFKTHCSATRTAVQADYVAKGITRLRRFIRNERIEPRSCSAVSFSSVVTSCSRLSSFCLFSAQRRWR
jgi:hypothetical protein